MGVAAVLQDPRYIHPVNWTHAVQAIYLLIVLAVCLRVIYDTRSAEKTLAYLILVVFAPVVGIAFYFSFGVNYRRSKMFHKKLLLNRELARDLAREVVSRSTALLGTSDINTTLDGKLVHLLLNDGTSALTAGNRVDLYLNGEEKFPPFLEALENAKDHIHIQYYIFEDDHIGRKVHDILVRKAKAGVQVRMMFDDFGSRVLRKRMMPELRAAGGEVHPFYSITFYALASRINYRNHRKILVVDGTTAFVGGINVSDKYINAPDSDHGYWRDTHLRIEGPAMTYLQYIFITDWNFCSGQQLAIVPSFFPQWAEAALPGDSLVQIVESGPDSDNPTILYSLYQAISSAQNEILITTPYFIPDTGLADMLKIAALSGVKVKLLVPMRSDSFIIDFAARSYFKDLLRVGVEIHRYTKGMVHAKTMVVDDRIAMVGTANLDIRSFDLNFEVNAVVYDKRVAAELRAAFLHDLTNAERIDPEQWFRRSKWTELGEKVAHLFSPLM